MAKCSPELLAWAQQHDVEDILKYDGDIERITSLYLNRQEYELSDCLDELIHLETLGLTGMDLHQFPVWVRTLKCLTYLNIWDNHIQVLPDWLGELTKLKRLYVRGNQIAILPRSITELLSLEEFDADYNKLTALPDDLGRLRSLKELKLTDIVIQQLICLIFMLKYRNYSAAIIKAGILLSNNNLSAWLDETPCLRQVEI